MTKKGFTIIELLIVITIISILVGVAVPYYNDYIYDARLSTLKQNLATYRSVLNQFRGDNLRGPFSVAVNNAGVPMLVDPKSGSADGSELVSGPIQMLENPAPPPDYLPQRRSNMKYLQSMPVFLNPKDGSPMPSSALTLTNSSAYFYDDDTDLEFDITNEFAYIENDNVAGFNDGIDQQLFNTVDFTTVTGARLPLDYTAITLTIDGVDY